MVVTDWVQTVAVIYFAWQQNRIFKRQNEIFAAQAGQGAMPDKTSRLLQLKLYWPTMVMVALMLFTGYDIYDRHHDSVVQPWLAYLLAAVICIAAIASAWLQKKPDASTQDKTTVNGVLAGLPKQAAPPLPASKLVIHSANYRAWQCGGDTHDVTEFLRNIIFGDSLVLDIENHNFKIGDHNFVPTDPLVGKVKRLRVTYSYKGDPTVTIERSEHDRLVLPEDSVIQRLAIEIQQLKGAQPKPSQYPIPQLRAKVLVLCSELQAFWGNMDKNQKLSGSCQSRRRLFSRDGDPPFRHGRPSSLATIVMK
jgi:hypothetical protein